jgi:tetratricopeptide (TPR) repeat protein
LEGVSRIVSAAAEYFKKAELAAKKGNTDYAIELVSQGLRLEPKNTEWRRKLHKLEAIDIEEKGGNPQGGMGVKFKVMPMLANVKKLSMQKKWDEAVLEIEKCLRLQPQHIGTLHSLALALESIEAPDAAISVYEEIIELDKANVEAYRKLGVLWASKDEPEKAITFWEKVVRYKPDDKEGGKAIRDLSAATMVKRSEERKQASGDESFTALLKDEDEAAELEKRSKVIRTDEDRREAIKYKTADLKKDRTNSRLWRDLGELYQGLKQWAHAEKAFREALKVNPQDLFAMEKIGTLRETRLEEELKQAETEVEAQKSAGKDVAEMEAQLQEKRAHMLKFKVDEYQRRVKAHPTDYDLKMKYGGYLLENTDYDEAIKQFQQSIKDPKFRIPSLNLNGICFLRKGIYDLAEAQFSEALNAVADKASELGKEIKYNLGDVCEKKGNTAKALTWYQQIMAVDIGYRDVSARVSKLMNGDGQT